MGNPNFQVLIVDDNEINRDMLARRLRRRDCQLSMAENGREAMSMLQNGSYDLVLLDIMMPEMDGYTVLKNLKQDFRLRHIPVIMISAIEEMGSVMRCMEIGADDYLTKPFDPDMLKAAINRCLPNLPNPPSIAPEDITSGGIFNFSGSNPSGLPTSESQISGFNLPEDTASKKSSLNLEEVVLRIMQSGIITRKSYLYFSKAIFNTLFENSGLSDQEIYQINSVLTAIHEGRIRVIDSTSLKR